MTSYLRTAAILVVAGLFYAEADAADSGTCVEPGPSGSNDNFLADFTTDAQGHGDGSLAIRFPEVAPGTQITFVVNTRVQFEDDSVSWSTGPLEAHAPVADWFIDVPLDVLWYLDTVQSMASDNVASIYVDARVNGGGYEDEGDGSGEGWPSTELCSAAARLNSSWGTAWNSYDGYYGVSY